MKKKIFLLFLGLLLLIVGTSPGLRDVSAHTHTITLPWSVISSGGMGGSAGSYTIHSTLGQPVAGTADEGTYHLTSGFWTEIVESLVEFFNFLPLILR